MDHLVVSHDAWLAARRALLEREKAFTRQGDDLSRLQRELPWEAVTKAYVFEGADGRETLAGLFAGRSQLLRADGFGGIAVHLNHRDVTMVVVSRAPYRKLDEYRRRMGWTSSGCLRAAPWPPARW